MLLGCLTTVLGMSCRLLHRMQHQLPPAQGKKRQTQLDSRRAIRHRWTIVLVADLCMAPLIIIAAQYLAQAASKGCLGYIHPTVCSILLLLLHI